MKEIGGVLLAVWWNGLFLKVDWSIYELVYRNCKSNFWLNQILNRTWLLLVLLLQMKHWFSRCLMFRDWFNSWLILRKWFSSCVRLREWFSSCVRLREWSSSCLRLGEWSSSCLRLEEGSSSCLRESDSKNDSVVASDSENDWIFYSLTVCLEVGLGTKGYLWLWC